MKKLLATLLVAVMIMSCMTVVSFAADTSVYTIENFPELDTSVSRKKFTDEFTAAYYDYLYNNTWDDAADDYTGPIAGILESIANGGDDVVPAALVTGDYVGFPVYITDAASVKVKIDYDETYLTLVTDYADGWANVVKDANDSFAYANWSTSSNTTGLLGVVYFAVNDLSALEGDENGLATTAVTFEIDSTCYIADENGKSGAAANTEMVVNLAGLTPGSAEEEAKALDDEAKATITANGTTVGIMSGANWSTFADGYTVEGTAPSADESFICVFGTIPEGYTAVEGKCGFTFTTYNGNVTKGYAKKIVDGKFGVVFYGLETALEGGSVEFFYE